MGTTALLIGGAISTAFSAIGQIQQAEAQADQAEFNQALAQREAERRRQRAETQRLAGQERAERLRRRGEKARGTARAAIGASGIDLGSGTTSDLLADEARKAELQVQDELFQTELQALDTESAAQNSEFQAQQSAQKASSLRAGGFFSAGSTLATGGFQVARRAGAFSGGSSLGGSSSSGGVAGNLSDSALRS